MVRLGVPREPQVRDSQHWPVRVPLAPTRGMPHKLGVPSLSALLHWSVAFPTLPLCPRLFDDFVGSEKERRRERHPECLGRLQIDDQMERGPLDGEVSGLDTVQDLLHKHGGALAQCARLYPIRQQAPCLGIVPPIRHGREPVLER